MLGLMCKEMGQTIMEITYFSSRIKDKYLCKILLQK
jgi:hypothetical protein